MEYWPDKVCPALEGEPYVSVAMVTDQTDAVAVDVPLVKLPVVWVL